MHTLFIIVLAMSQATQSLPSVATAAAAAALDHILGQILTSDTLLDGMWPHDLYPPSLYPQVGGHQAGGLRIS